MRRLLVVLCSVPFLLGSTCSGGSKQVKALPDQPRQVNYEGFSSSARYDQFKQRKIAILTFENDAVEEYNLSFIVPDALERELAKIPEINLIGRTKIKPIEDEVVVGKDGKKKTKKRKRRRMRRLRRRFTRIKQPPEYYKDGEALDVAKENGAAYALIGSIWRDEGGYRIEARMIGTDEKAETFFLGSEIGPLSSLHKTVRRIVLKFVQHIALEHNWALIAKIAAPVHYVNGFVPLMLEQVPYAPEQDRDTLVEAAFDLDPFYQPTVEAMKSAALKQHHAAAMKRFDDKYYDKAKMTRRYYLFYRSLYDYLAGIGLHNLLTFKIEDKVYAPNYREPDLIDGAIKVSARRSLAVDLYVKDLMEEFDFEYELIPVKNSPPFRHVAEWGSISSDEIFDHALFMQTPGPAPYWQYIFGDSIDSDFGGGSGYWANELPRISRAGIYFEFKVQPQGAELSDANNEFGSYLFAVGPGVYYTNRGGLNGNFLSKGIEKGNYLGELLAFGLAYNSSHHWARSQKDRSVDDRVFSIGGGQENNFRVEEYFTFTYSMARKDIHKPIKLIVTGGNTTVSSPVQEVLDIVTLFE